MTVDSRPSDDSRSFCDISRWNRAIESVSVLNVVASSRASSSSQRLPWRERDLARQVAGGRHLAHHVGDGRQRPRDGARDGEAEERRQEHGDDRRDGELGVNRLRGRASCSVRDRRISATGPALRAGRVAGAERPRQRDVFLAAERDVARRRSSRRRSASAGRVVARQRRGEDLAVHAEGDVAAGDLLQLRRQRVVEQEADAERAEDLRLRAGRSTIGTVTSCRMPSGCGSRLRLSRPASASRTAGWLATIAAGARRAADGREHVARSCW